MDGAARIARYREDKRKKRALQKAKWWSENKHSIDRQIANADRPVSSAAARKRLERQRKKDTRLKERERRTDYRRRKKDEQLTTPNQKTQTFANRMIKSRAVRKLSSALPTTPMKRIDTLKTYLSKTKSPTVKHLHEVRMIWPSGTSDGNEASENNMIIANIKEIVQTTKKQRSPEALMIMNSLTTATCSNNMNKTNVCRKLGLNKKRQRKGVVKREKVLTSTNAAWINTARKAKSDALSLETKKRVFDFWTEPGVSRPTGNKNDIKRIRTGTNEYTTHPVHILEKTQAEVYSDFKNKYPDIKISTRSFEKLKPFFVLPVRQKDKETCCCRYHVEIRSVFKTCMDYRKKLLKTKSNPEINVYDSLNDLIKDSLCPKETGALTHKKVCLERKCEKCGVKNIKFLDEELSSSEGADEVNWEKYEYKNIAKGEKTVRKLMLTKQCTKVEVMFKYFKDIIGSFAEHSFRAQWQNQQMKALIESLPLNQCLAIHDYSESYRCFDKQELQSGFFQKNEVSLHVTLLYRHAIPDFDGIESTKDNPVVLKEEIFVISEDDKRDQHFTAYVQSKVAEHLTSIGYKTELIHEFTDGCPVQYKSRHCFGSISLTACDLQCDVIRNYFETSHAKGPQDAAGGFIKRNADFAVLRGQTTIQSAKDLFHFCKDNLTAPKTDGCKRRLFFFVEQIPRTSDRCFKTVNEVRKVHSIKASHRTPGKVRASDLSCYSCEKCSAGALDSCDNMDIRGIEKPLTTFKESNKNGVQEQQNDMTNIICPGTVVALYTNDPDQEYYLMSVNEVRMLESDEEDDWGDSFVRGSHVVFGHYYDKTKIPYRYKLLPRQKTINYINSVKFVFTESSVKLSKTTIELNEEFHGGILASM